MKQEILISCFMVITCLASSQVIEVGFEAGYGIIYDITEVFNPMTPRSVDNCLTGFSFAFYPQPSYSYAITADIIYQRNGLDGQSIHFLKVPFGINAIPGKNVQGIFGAGFFVTWLMDYSKTITNYDFINHHSDFQLGGYLEAGMKIQLTQLWSILIKGNFELEYTTLYKELLPDHSGGTHVGYEKGYGFSVMIGCRYKFKAGKDQNKK